MNKPVYIRRVAVDYMKAHECVSFVLYQFDNGEVPEVVLEALHDAWLEYDESNSLKNCFTNFIALVHLAIVGGQVYETGSEEVMLNALYLEH